MGTVNLSEVNRTIEHLLRCGVSRNDAERIAYSGYVYWESQESLVDSFYGTTISYEDLLSQKSFFSRPVRNEYFSSLEEANEIIHRFSENKREGMLLTFRGMNKEYFLCDSKLRKRYLTNPWSLLVEGKEPSLLPTYWREHFDESGLSGGEPEHARRRGVPHLEALCQEQFFMGLAKEAILYHRIDFPAIRKLRAENMFFTISDLEDAEDPNCKEYYKRWQNSMYGTGEAALIAQHYGLQTRYLDITYDLKVAIFFSLYHYKKKENGKATYEYKVNENAAVYCFDFDNLTKEEDIYRKAVLFEHATPERPLRQKCTGFCTGKDDMNAAAKYLVLRLKPRTDFDLSGIPTPDELFPPRETDRFYDLLLQYKEKAAKSPLYKNLDEKNCFKKAIDSIIEYEF